jgi:hypothetical protein
MLSLQLNIACAFTSQGASSEAAPQGTRAPSHPSPSSRFLCFVHALLARQECYPDALG